MQNWDVEYINQHIAEIHREAEQLRLAKAARAHDISLVNRIITAFNHQSHYLLHPRQQQHLADARRITAVNPRLDLQDSAC